MSREAFEIAARGVFPELDLTRTPEGNYRVKQAEDWWTGWKLARGESLRCDSDIVRWGDSVKVGGMA